MQLSMVFSQRRWPGIRKDLDDCWAVSAVQAVNVTSPWLRQVGVTAFRRAAKNPDVAGQADGGTISEVAAGIRGCYPSLKGHLIVLRGDPWTRLEKLLEAGHPVTVAIDSSKLREDLAFGTNVLHQVMFAKPDRLADTPKVVYCNPLAQPYSRPLDVKLDLFRDAVMSFGAHTDSGNRGVWAVALPTDDEALAIRHEFADDTPFDQDDVDEATAKLQARIDAALEALDG